MISNDFDSVLFSTPMKLLVTGGTGFLGGAIMARLLQTPLWESSSFLVRGTTAAAGAERLRETLRNFAVDETQIAKLRVEQVICGDLADVRTFENDPRLGLVDVVINSAAVTSFGKHPQIWPVNSEGTEAFAAAVHRHGRLRRFVQVGTAMAVGPRPENPVPEIAEPGMDVRHLVDYTASKIEGERRLRALPGLPLVVTRPSIVIGHTKLGCAPSGSIYWVFRMGMKMRAFMCPLDAHIDVIPVDYAADSLIHLALKPALAHDLYHISAGPVASCSFREIDLAVAPVMKRLPISDFRHLPYEGFVAMQSQFKDLFGPCNRRLMLLAIKLYGAFAGLDMVFDNTRLLAEGVRPAPRFDSYAALCQQTSMGISISDQMMPDFK